MTPAIDNIDYRVALKQICRTVPATFAQGEWILNGYIPILADLQLDAGALGDRFDIAYTPTNVFAMSELSVDYAGVSGGAPNVVR
ncbi:hypothetical protein MSIMFI_01827 [Mycobacterium simulans]|uniref:hypothetical protein n=1 Tax=Mycobacterium simulans TaxID=627089 RepID=UPI001749B7DF|nr:hypothetical protein [Mycobacterium simulans]SON60333.1 hypothetical protein MSIMFI_01827 [Mycobacterium simulans]